LGFVKNFNEEKGYGFISVPGEKDIFFLRGSLEGGASVVQANDKVAFTKVIGDRGPRGEDVQILPPGTEIPGMGGGGGAAMGMMGGSSASVPSGPTYEGVVKRYDDDRGFGFIDCDILRQSTGKDVMLLRSVLNGITVKVGDRVTFTVEENGGKGVKASSVQLAPPGMGMMGGMGGCGGMGGGGGAAMIPNSGPLYFGEIRRYDDDKGYGFIECPESKAIYNKDIFLLRSAMKSNAEMGRVGDKVSFNVTVGNKGPVAENVTIIGHASDAMGGNTFMPPPPAPPGCGGGMGGGFGGGCGGGCGGWDGDGGWGKGGGKGGDSWGPY